MLILTRGTGESVVIGSDVVVTVVAVENGKVRLGVAAPREVQVHREEVAQRIKVEGRQAPARG